jgi:hypothetical protein
MPVRENLPVLKKILRGSLTNHPEWGKINLIETSKNRFEEAVGVLYTFSLKQGF